MSPHADADILSLFETLALDAGRAIMEVFDREFLVESKADDSPVTEADARAEEIILKGLRARFSGIPCVAEEEASAGLAPGKIDGEFFLVDPLDGTREFVNRNKDFTVNLALIRNGEPVIGLVYAPARHVLYGGRAGLVYVSDVENHTMGECRGIGVRARPTTPVLVASRSHRTSETNDYITDCGEVELVSVGSSLKFCLLAEGSADIYPRFGRTMEWDTAAGDAILRAAGGHVRTIEGAPLVYGKRNQPHDADFANPWFIATAS